MIYIVLLSNSKLRKRKTVLQIMYGYNYLIIIIVNKLSKNLYKNFIRNQFLGIDQNVLDIAATE